MIAGWKLSLDNSKKLVDKLLKIKKPFLSRILNTIVSLALNAMENWINDISKDPNVIENVYSNINIRKTYEVIKITLPAIIEKKTITVHI